MRRRPAPTRKPLPAGGSPRNLGRWIAGSLGARERGRVVKRLLRFLRLTELLIRTAEHVVSLAHSWRELRRALERGCGSGRVAGSKKGVAQSKLRGGGTRIVGQRFAKECNGA